VATQLFQQYPRQYSRHYIGQYKSWTESIEAAGNLGRSYRAVLFANEQEYRWTVTVKLRNQVEPVNIRRIWTLACRRLRKWDVVGFWVLEVTPTNAVHWHILVCNDWPEDRVRQCFKKAMSGLVERGKAHIGVKEITDRWHECDYILKASEYWANKRVLFVPRLGLTKTGHINSFWVPSKGDLQARLQARTEAFYEGIPKETLHTAYQLHQLIDGWYPVGRILKNLTSAANKGSLCPPAERVGILSEQSEREPFVVA
jgi:hypothetical protein